MGRIVRGQMALAAKKLFHQPGLSIFFFNFRGLFRPAGGDGNRWKARPVANRFLSSSACRDNLTSHLRTSAGNLWNNNAVNPFRRPRKLVLSEDMMTPFCASG